MKQFLKTIILTSASKTFGGRVKLLGETHSKTGRWNLPVSAGRGKWWSQQEEEPCPAAGSACMWELGKPDQLLLAMEVCEQGWGWSGSAEAVHTVPKSPTQTILHPNIALSLPPSLLSLPTGGSSLPWPASMICSVSLQTKNPAYKRAGACGG